MLTYVCPNKGKTRSDHTKYKNSQPAKSTQIYCMYALPIKWQVLYYFRCVKNILNNLRNFFQQERCCTNYISQIQILWSESVLIYKVKNTEYVYKWYLLMI